MDIDTIGPGEDFAQVIRETVDSCHVFIAVIGKNWLTITDKSGNRRLDNPKDFVRLEIASALDHKIRVIPVLVDGAHFPEEEDLPDELAPLVRHNALEISDKRFHHDTTQLITAIEKIISLEQEQSGRQKNETEGELRSTLEEGKVDHFRESAQFSKPLTSAPPRSAIKRILLLYRPSHDGDWKYRVLFYLFAFIMIPFFSLAALGAYVGPEKTLGGIPAVVFLVVVTIYLRHLAIRAEQKLSSTRHS